MTPRPMVLTPRRLATRVRRVRLPRCPPDPSCSAEILSIGSELTVGETRDTNAGDLARSLTGLGVAVTRIQALPDELGTVLGAVRDGDRPRRPRRLDRRARPDAGRPDPRGDRGSDRGRADCRPRPGALAARAVVPAGDAVPRDEPEAGLARAVGGAPAESQRDGARVVGRAGRWPPHRRVARAPPRNDADVDRSRPAAAPRARRRDGRRPADAPARGHRRVAGRRPPGRDDAPGDRPDRRDVRPSRRRGRPHLGAGLGRGRGRRAGLNGRRPRRDRGRTGPGHPGRPRLGGGRCDLGGGDRECPGGPRRDASDPRGRDGRLARHAPRRPRVAHVRGDARTVDADRPGARDRRRARASHTAGDGDRRGRPSESGFARGRAARTPPCPSSSSGPTGSTASGGSHSSAERTVGLARRSPRPTSS